MPARARLTGLWRHPDFVKLWSGQAVSQFGSQITNLALQLTAILTLNATVAELGVLRACLAAPFLLFGLIAGVWVDRARRRPLLIWADVGRAVAIGAIPLAAMLGVLRIELLYAVGFLFGILTLFFEASYQAFLPALVGRERLIEGNSKLETSAALAQVAGPGLAGALIQALSAPFALALDALSFVVSAVSLVAIRKPEPPRPVRDARSTIRAEIAEGVRLIAGQPPLRRLLIYNIMGNLADTIAYTVLVLYLIRDLGWSPLLIGVLTAGGSVGGLFGALATARLTGRIGLGAALSLGAFLYATYLLLLPLVSGPVLLTLPLLLGATGLGAFGSVLFRINNQSLRQRLVPDGLQGRLSATWRSITWGMYAVGGLLGGLLGSAIGVRPTLIVAGVLAVAAFLWVYCSPLRALQAPPSLVDER